MIRVVVADDQPMARERLVSLLAALPRPRFRRAFEPGCATGLLTEALARRCDQVVAWDVAEAAMVHTLLERGVSHMMVRRAIAHLGDYGRWPLSEAQLAVSTDGARRRIFLREREGAYALTPRGWQLTVAPPPMEDVRLRLRRS